MTRRPCITPRCPHLTTPGRPRCLTCEQQHQRDRNARRAHYHGDWPRIAAAAVAAHRAQVGDWCPGWAVPPHRATDLTCDHVQAGTRAGGLTVLCRGCNARKGNSAHRNDLLRSV